MFKVNSLIRCYLEGFSLWNCLYHICHTWSEIKAHHLLVDNLTCIAICKKTVLIEFKHNFVSSCSNKTSIKPLETHATTISNIIHFAY